jgi:hypothetical protein
MNKLLWSLVVGIPVLGAAAAGVYFLQETPNETAAVPPEANPQRVVTPQPAPAPAPETPGVETPIAMKFAVKPKEFSPAVKRGLEYLVNAQQDDGGWNQGGGWRVGNGGGGRVAGKEVEDPSDIGNTSLALLALVRAGNTPTEGEYKDAVKKGLAFVLARIDKADTDSLYVTDVRNTQLQSKIGPYVDTFLANLLLAELKGKAGSQDKSLVAALDKTMKKIVKHQGADGNFAGNGGWAPVLSVGIANKSIARANLNGVNVDGVVLNRAFSQSNASVNGLVMGGSGRSIEITSARTESARAISGETKPPPDVGFFASLAGKSAPASAGFWHSFLRGSSAYDLDAPSLFTRDASKDTSGSLGDAGVTLYRVGQGAGNSQDIVNSLNLNAAKAQEVLKDAKATEEAKKNALKSIEAQQNAISANAEAQNSLAARVRDPSFVAGFGSNGGEEFLSFLNISESLLIKGGKDWEDWDARMAKGMEKAQDKDGSWQGQHCITGKTFCTAGALLVLMADRTQFPPEVFVKAEVKPWFPWK